MKPLEYLLERILIDFDTGCWNWTGRISEGTCDGYGWWSTYRARQANLSPLTHRAMYQLLVSPVPHGIQLDHLCRNRACCNPAHLDPVTPRVNVLRSQGVAAVNASKDRCLRGHLFTSQNTRRSRLGGRVCRTCARDWMRARRSARGRVNADGFTGFSDAGRQQCLTCGRWTHPKRHNCRSLPIMEIGVDSLAFRVACSYCEVSAGEPCKTRQGRRARTAHDDRWVDAQRFLSAKDDES